LIIENDTWIGGNVTILPGFHIGSNVVIGAGSVVTRDIPNQVIATGNPCAVTRENLKKYAKCLVNIWRLDTLRDVGKLVRSQGEKFMKRQGTPDKRRDTE